MALAGAFYAQGVDGLLHDKTRRARIPALSAAVHEQTVAKTLSDPPGEVTHWTAAMTAKAIGISSVHRIWRAHRLQPHRLRQFKLSRLSDTERAMLVGGACARAHGWSPKKPRSPAN